MTCFQRGLSEFTERTLHYLFSIIITLFIALSVAVSSVALAAPSPGAQKDDLGPAEKRLNLLKLADVSSPHATLNNFLLDMENVIKEFNKAGSFKNREVYHSYVRLLSMLNYSSTPDGNSRWVMTTRVLLLYEILSRIELPPFDKIPGTDEMSAKSITKWSVPNTAITIQRVAEGPRVGDFLFSAKTVQNLSRFYRKVDDLPYKSGVLPGIYEKFLKENTTGYWKGRLVQRLLEPIDRDDPRSVFQGFTKNVNLAYNIVMQADGALRADPPTMTIDEAKKAEIQANNFLQKAVKVFDLSKVPSVVRNDVAIESVLLLKEILDRLGLPPLDVIPDMEMVDFERRRRTEANSGPVRWRIPNTTIELVEIEEGSQKGLFIFSANSVKQLPELYEKIKDLPYQENYSEVAIEYQSPGLSEGFYEYYISTPGQLIPFNSILGKTVEKLPNGFKKVIRGQAVWQWSALLLSGVFAAMVTLLSYRVLFKHQKQRLPASQLWIRVIFNLCIVVLAIILQNFLDSQVNLTGSLLILVGTILHGTYWVMIATAIFLGGSALAENIIASPRIDPEGLKASYIRAIFGTLSFSLMLVVFVYGLSQIGVSLVPLLASLGIGGLAIALAIRPTLENIIGSFMIFLDKPFRVGQRVNVMGQNGTVEAIGLRSTKIRLLTGPLTSIPNKKLVDIEIENIGRTPHIRRLFNVTITYDTPPDKIVRAVELLKEILAVPEPVKAKPADFSDAQKDKNAHPNEAINVPGFLPQVYFNELNADSLNIIVFYWYHPAEHWDYLEHANWINIQIMERFNAEDIDFAFPTQTLHVAGDEKRPLTVGQRWKTEEETLFPSTISAQTAALKARKAQTMSTSVSDKVRPEAKGTVPKKTLPEGELNDAPIEDDQILGGPK